jgi:hypothetical protein
LSANNQPIHISQRGVSFVRFGTAVVQVEEISTGGER